MTGFASSERVLLAAAGLHGLVAVAIGAFAAHGMADPAAIGWVETASRYQLGHAAALLALVAARGRLGRGFGLAALGLAVGPAIFSGALYGLAFTGVRLFGAVAPIGGLLMMLGWAALIVGAVWPGSDRR